MSNLFKSINVVCKNNEAKIIDNNAFIYEKITKNNEMIACSLEEDNIAVFVEGIEPKDIEIVKDEDVSLHAQQIINDANSEANAILENALHEAENLKTDIFTKVKKEAYETAIKEAGQEINKIKQELDLRKQQQDEEYNNRLNEMEPMLIDAILKVFNNVTHVLSEDKKDMILYLVNSVLTKTEICRNFIIRVSKEDYLFLIESKDKIYGAVVKDANIEIIEDLTMKRNQCIIETDGGIYDCSLDIQLENLIREIKTLSCMLD